MIVLSFPFLFFPEKEEREKKDKKHLEEAIREAEALPSAQPPSDFRSTIKQLRNCLSFSRSWTFFWQFHRWLNLLLAYFWKLAGVVVADALPG